MIEDIIRFMGTNEIALGFASFCGISGFLLTIVVTIRTAKISKILRYNQVTERYNKERTAYLKAFEGHRTSITEDGIKTEKILKDILSQVEAYRTKFNEILTIQEKVTLFLCVRMLKKEASAVDWNSVCNYLARFSGRLSKKEDKKNG